MAVGAIIIGIDILNPNIVVFRSTFVTSTNIQGRNLIHTTSTKIFVIMSIPLMLVMKEVP